MCCEATDALLEYVRRYLGLTGLRNLNAPRRLKLRVPVLKEWLQRQGQHGLAASIPDWDPVRRPTGRWKAWEMQHLKPIMDEKAVERQAKRNLVSGEATQLRQIRDETEGANRQEAIDALMAVAGNSQAEEGITGGPEGAIVPAPPIPAGEQVDANDYSVMVVDDANEGGSQEGEGDVSGSPPEEGSSQADDGISNAADVMAAAMDHAKAIRGLLLRMEPIPGNELHLAALYNTIRAVDHLNYELQGAGVLASCPLRPNGEMGPTPRDPVPVWPGHEGGPAMLKSGDGERPEHVSSQEEAALLLGASQVSLSGSVLEGVVDVPQSQDVDSQPDPMPDQASSDATSPRDGPAAADAITGVKREVMDEADDDDEQEAAAAACAAEEEHEGGDACGGALLPKRQKLLAPEASDDVAAPSPGGGAFATSQEQDRVLGAILENAASQ